MISNFTNPFAVLDNTEDHVFHLTGSRYFGGVTENSDWDFFVQHTPEVEAYLHKRGFVPADNVSFDYKDASVVMKRNVHGIKMDIQLVPNAAHKLQAQDILKPFLSHLPKVYHSRMWSIALDHVTAG